MRAEERREGERDEGEEEGETGRRRVEAPMM